MAYWQKQRRRFDLPEVIRRLTSDTAEAAGLLDRGVIRTGKKADLNVIDDPARQCAGRFTIAEREHSVHEHVDRAL